LDEFSFIRDYPKKINLSMVTFTTAQPVAPAAYSFPGYVLRQQKRYLFIALPAILLQFVVLKLLYPYPDFISDSYSYISTAELQMSVNLWPVGYSWFISALHMLTSSDIALLACQYFFLEASLLLFFYTFLYFYRPARNTSNILFIFLFCNPLFLWLSNAVLSDALFNSLSIIWWVQFLWMLNRPKLYQVFILAVVLGIAFTIRYTAMYYPLVAAVAFTLSSHQLRWKIIGSLMGVVIIIPFVLFTKQKTKEVTGTPEFSVFGSWQLANNALYMYDHIEVDSTKIPPESRELDRLVRSYFKAVPPQYRELDPFPGTFFIKTPDAPLKVYMMSRYNLVSPEQQFKVWGMVSPIYNSYGTWLIRHYPLAFARYYLWLNTKNYFLPHLEKYGNYNSGSDGIGNAAQYWFHYETNIVRSASKKLPGIIFFAYPPVFMILNFYFYGAVIWLLITGRWRNLHPLFVKTLLLLVSYLVVNFAFSIFATPVVLRYQVLPFILLFSYSLLLLEFTDNSRKKHISLMGQQ